MTALLWLTTVLVLSAIYIRIGKHVALVAGRRAYALSDARFRQNYPFLSRDAVYRHNSAQDDARFAYWPALFFWPIALVVMFVRGRVDDIDFSPDGERLQQKIVELERELGMRR